MPQASFQVPSNNEISDPQARAKWVKAFGKKLEFDAVGVAAAGSIDDENRLGQWLGRNYHGVMAWMERTQALRQDVTQKLPGARSVVVVARNYHAPRPKAPPASGRVASYAWGRDYHRVLRRPLRELAQGIASLESDSNYYASIDSGPVLERAWAARAGVASIGKNSLGLRRDLGSYFFLATIITTVELAPDSPLGDLCGSCTACLDACPTGAIVEPYVVDSRACISYQTIENHGDVPEELHKAHADWIFGCDICQEVCPWNRFATPTTEPDFFPRADHANPKLDKLAAMSEEEFRNEFAGTPIMRAKWRGMLRNAGIALRNVMSKSTPV